MPGPQCNDPPVALIAEQCSVPTTTTAARKKGWTLELKLKIYNILYILRKKLPGSGVAAALMTGKNKFKLSIAGERRRRRWTGARTSRLFVLSTEVAGAGAAYYY